MYLVDVNICLIKVNLGGFHLLHALMGDSGLEGFVLVGRMKPLILFSIIIMLTFNLELCEEARCLLLWCNIASKCMLLILSLTCPTCCVISNFAFFFLELLALFGRFQVLGTCKSLTR